MKKSPTWNLKLLYSSASDPQIEKDMKTIEKLYDTFATRFDSDHKKYLTDEMELLNALNKYEKIREISDCKPLLYFNYIKDTDVSNKYAAAQMALLSDRMAKSANKIIFFFVSLGTIPLKKQDEFLRSPKLAPFKVFLERVFSDAKYRLSVAEEKIINLKNLTSYDMWIDGNDRALGQLSVLWKGKTLPIPAALKMIRTLKAEERYKLDGLINEKFKSISFFSESEINAIYTDKKTEDELRGYKSPFESTVRGYRNDPKVVENLVKVVTESFPIAHRFYKIKARMLGQKKMRYADRMAEVGKIKTKYTFEQSLKVLKKTFGNIDKKYVDILETFVKNGQIDVAPRIGKIGGAYCSPSYLLPTFVLLNHTDNLDSLTTLAHEMGHAFHSELSRSQSSFYFRYSMSLAETASTLFESIALESIIDTLPEKEKITLLHNSINDDIATIFRQIACFNFELDLHNEIRKKGFVPKEEIVEIHNKNMKAYLGPLFEMKPADGYFFVDWSHLRRFFYVYSYAYGQIVTKALLRKYRQDKNFWKSIEKFLSAGSKASPEEILLEIGIDVSKPDFWMEGLKEIEENIKKLEAMV